MSVYGKIHTARFGKQEEEIAPLEFVRPLSELCLRAAALHFRQRPTFAGVPEKYKVSCEARRAAYSRGTALPNGQRICSAAHSRSNCTEQPLES
jgi:hypothetical protein